MDISPLEAKKSLGEVERIGQATRITAAYAGADITIFAWGLIWILGFLGSHGMTQPGSNLIQWQPVLWGVLILIGIIVTISVGRHYSSGIQDTSGKRIGMMWWATYAYIWLGYLILGPYINFKALASPDGLKCIAAICSIIPMFAYIIMGLMLKQNYLIWFALALTALTFLGYWAFHPVFWIWMAVICGGSFIGTAIYMRLRRMHLVRNAVASEAGHV